MQKWEYLVLAYEDGSYEAFDHASQQTVEYPAGWHLNGKHLQGFHRACERAFASYFNVLGIQGWELVSNSDGRFVFKRPKP